jgi:GH25 family lysozyme M1 (1,4-beta-N-acetylmuramidase)
MALARSLVLLAAIGTTTLIGASVSAFAEPYECSYDKSEEAGPHLEIDPANSIYRSLEHIEGSPRYEIKFMESNGSAAAVIKYLGTMQGENQIDDTTSVSTFILSEDGKFVEVGNSGQLSTGTCIKASVAGGDTAAKKTELSGNPFSRPWDNPDTAIVLDPYAGNSIDWDQVATDKRVAAVIHKASQGVKTDDKYSDRKQQALAKGYAWGSYHLLTTANATTQIDHYLSLVGTEATESRAVDVECLQGESSCQVQSFKVSYATIEAALRRVKEKTGHFPLVYANHSVATKLSARWKDKAEFSDVKLWYARFKNNVTDFPTGPWSSYSIWQFSSEINCTASSCPYRVPGTQRDMDLNVYFGTAAQLKASWPLER